MKTATYALCGSLIASAGEILCGLLAYTFPSATWFQFPLLPGCIIGYFFIYGDRGENGRAEFWATVVSLPFWMLVGAYVGAVVAWMPGRAKDR